MTVINTVARTRQGLLRRCTSFALIKIALEAGVAPPWVAFGRCSLGALTLLVICVLWRTRCPASLCRGHAR
jgi:hypothetical protein